MKVVQLTLNTFLLRILGESVILMIDNAAVVAYLKKQKGTITRVMHSLVQDIVGWTELYSRTLSARYIPGKNIISVDQLSCSYQVHPIK